MVDLGLQPDGSGFSDGGVFLAKSAWVGIDPGTGDAIAIVTGSDWESRGDAMLPWQIGGPDTLEIKRAGFVTVPSRPSAGPLASTSASGTTSSASICRR